MLLLISGREEGGEGEREERERERERNIDVRKKHQSVASHTHPDRGSNPQPFGVHVKTPNNGATWPGLYTTVLIKLQLLSEL